MIEYIVKRTVVQNTLKLPPFLLRKLIGKRQVIDGNKLDPQVQCLLLMANRLRTQRVYEVPLANAREIFQQEASVVDVSNRDTLQVENRSVSVLAGTLPLRIYRPRGIENPAPIIVYFHGGGWVIGNLDTHDRSCRVFAEEARAIVISVDYRLAPEHKFPAAYDDCYTAFRWACEFAGELGGQGDNVAVAGDSAGGNLAAVVSLRAREEGTQSPSMQFLIYPVTDSTGSMTSRKTFAKGYLLEKDVMDWFYEQYVSKDISPKDPRVSPLFADCTNLPKTLVLTAGYDPLRDEGKAYADKLRDAGVSVSYRCSGGQVHGFWGMGGVIRQAYQEMVSCSHEVGKMLRNKA